MREACIAHCHRERGKSCSAFCPAKCLLVVSLDKSSCCAYGILECCM